MQIEQVRLKMYHHYNNDPDDPNILNISKELDHLLNQLSNFNTEQGK
nr:aspartyl-phosphate phosphatase Spo0E family protein [Halobacillus andaensis]